MLAAQIIEEAEEIWSSHVGGMNEGRGSVAGRNERKVGERKVPLVVHWRMCLLVEQRRRHVIG